MFFYYLTSEKYFKVVLFYINYDKMQTDIIIKAPSEVLPSTERAN